MDTTLYQQSSPILKVLRQSDMVQVEGVEGGPCRVLRILTLVPTVKAGAFLSGCLNRNADLEVALAHRSALSDHVQSEYAYYVEIF